MKQFTIENVPADVLPAFETIIINAADEYFKHDNELFISVYLELVEWNLSEALDMDYNSVSLNSYGKDFALSSLCEYMKGGMTV